MRILIVVKHKEFYMIKHFIKLVVVIVHKVNMIIMQMCESVRLLLLLKMLNIHPILLLKDRNSFTFV